MAARVRFVDDAGIRGADRQSVLTVLPGATAAITGLIPDLDRPPSGPTG